MYIEERIEKLEKTQVRIQADLNGSIARVDSNFPPLHSRCHELELQVSKQAKRLDRTADNVDHLSKEFDKFIHVGARIKKRLRSYLAFFLD